MSVEKKGMSLLINKNLRGYHFESLYILGPFQLVAYCETKKNRSLCLRYERNHSIIAKGGRTSSSTVGKVLHSTAAQPSMITIARSLDSRHTHTDQ